MPSRETTRKFTGFIAYYDSGKVIKEKENFYSNKLKKDLSTSWQEINKDKLIKLELHWRGVFKVSVSKKEFPFIKPSDWFFSQSGCMDLSSRKIQIVSRNIGYIKDGINQLFSVAEQTGTVRIHNRVA